MKIRTAHSLHGKLAQTAKQNVGLFTKKSIFLSMQWTYEGSLAVCGTSHVLSKGEILTRKIILFSTTLHTFSQTYPSSFLLLHLELKSVPVDDKR